MTVSAELSAVCVTVNTPLTGPADLRQALVRRPTPFVRTFAENLMAYGLGRRLESYDMPTVRAIVREAKANGHRLSAFIRGVVNSPAWSHRLNKSLALVHLRPDAIVTATQLEVSGDDIKTTAVIEDIPFYDGNKTRTHA